MDASIGRYPLVFYWLCQGGTEWKGKEVHGFISPSPSLPGCAMPVAVCLDQRPRIYQAALTHSYRIARFQRCL